MPDDVKTLALPVLSHRVVSREQGDPDRAREALREVVEQVPAPL